MLHLVSAILSMQYTINNILGKAVPFCNVGCSTRPLTASTVECNFLIVPRLLKSILFLELSRIQDECTWQDRQREIHCRGDGTLEDFIRFADVDEILVLAEMQQAISLGFSRGLTGVGCNVLGLSSS